MPASVAPASVVIAAGGTGGHIYPGLAVAEALRRREPATRISFLGTPRGLERTIVVEAGFALHLVDMVPFAGRTAALLPIALVRATVQARRILRRERADVAVGMGAYVGVPLIVAARLTGLPCLIHESGAVPGRANLWTARLSGNVATAFAEAGGAFPSSATVRTVGMPLGPELNAFDRAELRAKARAAYGIDDTTLFLLVNGGSQGAASLNRLTVGLAERWRHRHDVRILLKAGRRDHDQTASALQRSGGAHLVELTRFIERMDHAYAAADVTLCRPGAGTVAELAVVGLPAVLVPYPHAPFDHQARNATALVEAGAALMVRDHEATPEVVGPLLERMLDDRGELERMRAGLRDLARPHAADEMAAWVLDLARAS
ncbi:MAG: undecaprenyldiphospho-muramoylpentapeptide beta-N-acetylglucosaminyltransferase [Actinomycetota bacterium]|nr:undecaprenyldiphospho-muramoylpentapeptide beta-N-acetylglucosaminyltransferase [Actinomycetota bacterium]MDP8954482.1 undecaprenyldiphospho-muramoylpentapeptide beta-N-acetylglucosaminyltransferase [Actinomycetota bacterium]